MPAPCPAEVIETGRSLISARKLARDMSEAIDDALGNLSDAIEVMTANHGAKAMQAGSAIAKLRQAQAAYGFIMEAHNDLRMVLVECDVEQPTDEQVASIR